MQLHHPRCAGLDVHQAAVVASIRSAEGREAVRETRTFTTNTKGLLELRDWLEEHGCTHVAMEATGVYWKPVWHVLEGSFELLLANATQVRALPGRKSDVNDAEWLAELLAHGLIRASFVPPEPFQDLRDLLRTRKQLVREVTRHVQRLQATLEDANVKVHVVLSDIMGASGRAILRALIAGESGPERLAELTRPGVKAPRPDVVESLRGRVRPHHRFMLQLHLKQVETLESAIAQIEQEVTRALEPFRLARQRLKTIPGISDIAAAVLISEVGVDMNRFPTAGHLVSWAGLCPRLDESADKKRSTRVRRGCPWLKTVLVQSAWAAIRVKGSSLQARYLRLKARRGAKKAIVAVAAAILTAAYHMLREGADYRELGPSYLDDRTKTRIANRLLKRIEDLGFKVAMEPAA